jgi:hypothetical protein
MGSNFTMSPNAVRRYRVIAVSLYDEEARAADRITEILRQAGWPKANRSLVIREALLRLEDELSEKSPEEIFRYFVDRYARRAGQLPYARKDDESSKPKK